MVQEIENTIQGKTIYRLGRRQEMVDEAAEQILRE
jgi:hypothetical protein